jgi:predicted Rossmann fold nucleotide-binding protein DprA/Smf involved in DNA uptake
MKCQGCGCRMDESYDHNGRKLCEDCYMDALSPAKTCDPWAAYTAGRLEAKEEDLSPDQRRILDLLGKGPAEVDRILEELGMDRPGLERAVAALRHMNRVRAFPSGGQKYLILYHQVNPDWSET